MNLSRQELDKAQADLNEMGNELATLAEALDNPGYVEIADARAAAIGARLREIAKGL